MPEIFGIPTQALFGQLLIGLINGSFYALLSLGLAVIFGLLNIINFTHGAQYMLGAFCAYFLLNKLGVGYWWSLAIAPLAVGAFGVLIVCLGTWFVIEKTRLGAYLRAATENPALVQAFGINVPRMIMLTYGFGVALAAFAGVMAAPIYQVNPQMGADMIIVVFAVVVIGGMGSIMGSIVTGFGLGVIEGLTKVFYPEASNTVIFLIMAIVLLIKPAILFGTAAAFLLGIVTGLLAIRRQGIYFAMITLALAQMIYFFYLQAPFTHGEDGIQAVPRGKLFGFIDLSSISVMYYTVLVIFI